MDQQREAVLGRSQTVWLHQHKSDRFFSRALKSSSPLLWESSFVWVTLLSAVACAVMATRCMHRSDGVESLALGRAHGAAVICGFIQTFVNAVDAPVGGRRRFRSCFGSFGSPTPERRHLSIRSYSEHLVGIVASHVLANNFPLKLDPPRMCRKRFLCSS
jgi:hypothetical protein